MNTSQVEWCGGLYRVDREQICSSVFDFLSQHNPTVCPQSLSHLAVTLEASAYDESACPAYYVETVVAKLQQANASMSPTVSFNPNAPEQTPCQQPLQQQQEWRNTFTRDDRYVVLKHMVLKLTSFNEGKSPQAISEAATVFENCTYVSVDSKPAYLHAIAEELTRCETYRTLPAPSAEVLSLSLQQQNQDQPCATQLESQSLQTQAITDSLPIPSSPSGPQNILTLEPGELLSHVFEQPNWKELLTAGDRQTIVRHIYSKLLALHLNETTQQMFQRAISFELNAYTSAQTGCSYLENLIEIIGRLQPKCASESSLPHTNEEDQTCVSEALLPPRRNEDEQAGQETLSYNEDDVMTLNGVLEQGPTVFGQEGM